MTESLPSLRDIRMDGKRLRWWVNAEGETCLLREDSSEWLSVVGRVTRGTQGEYTGVSSLFSPGYTHSFTIESIAAGWLLYALQNRGVLLYGVSAVDL